MHHLDVVVREDMGLAGISSRACQVLLFTKQLLSEKKLVDASPKLSPVLIDVD